MSASPSRCKPPVNNTQATITRDGAYTAGPRLGRDVIVVTDPGTGLEAEAVISVVEDPTLSADPPQLFDLAADPSERRNLAANPAHAARAAAMAAAMRERWDLDAFDAAVRDSQARRLVVYEALRNGAYYPWDYQPLQKASERYMRNHMDLNVLEEAQRFPRGE